MDDDEPIDDLPTEPYDPMVPRELDPRWTDYSGASASLARATMDEQARRSTGR